MNGHSVAETIAWRVDEIRRQWDGAEFGDSAESPVFLFAAGRWSGEDAFSRRLPFRIASEAVFDPALLKCLADQLSRVSTIMRRHEDAVPGPNGRGAGFGIATAVAAQGRYLADMCRSCYAAEPCMRWGLLSTRLTGEYAHYLKLLFRNARFVFLHRNPVEVLKCHLNQAGLALAEPHSDLAARFAEKWCRAALSVEQAAAEVGGMLIGCDQALSVDSAPIERYLEINLSSPSRADEGAASAEDLHPADLALLAERAGAVAERLGHRLKITQAEARQVPADAPAGAPRIHVADCVARNANCAVLVPTMRYVEPECDDALVELERRGYAVIRLRGCSSIDHARSQLATLALERGFDETLWVDADICFDPQDVDRLRAHKLPIVAGIYARKSPCGRFAMAPMPGTVEITMGEAGGLTEVLYAGTGFLLVQSGVYETIQRRFNLPLCDGTKSHRSIPFFMPMLEQWGGQMSHLGEDYAFSRRARLCGYKIMADTSIALWHIGPYRYGYEDAGNAVERVAAYRHVFESEKTVK